MGEIKMSAVLSEWRALIEAADAEMSRTIAQAASTRAALADALEALTALEASVLTARSVVTA